MKSLMKNNRVLKRLTIMLAMIMLLVLSVGMTAFAKGKSDTKNSLVTVNAAAEDAVDDVAADNASATKGKAMAAAIAVGLAAGAGAIGMGLTIAKSEESIARQPEAEGKIRTTMMLGLVFIETAIIYALVVAILIIFVM